MINSVNSFSFNSPIRITGMFSGMDTNKIIEAAMRSHQARIDNQARNRTIITWRQDLHNQTRTEIQNIRNNFLSTQGRNSLMNRNLYQDTDKAIQEISAFIDDYNKLIERLEGLLNERKSSTEAGFRPLTEAERMEMSDREIERWEAIAKKGIMRNDSDIRNLVTNLRRQFFETIEGAGISASELGLSTGNFFGGTGGKIIIDENRLRSALEANPDKVADVFMHINTSEGETRGTGLLYRLDSVMSTYLRNTQSITMPSFEAQTKQINDRISTMQNRMLAEEEKLHRQFAAMESIMAQLQTQSDWFQAMLNPGK
jgi:flagellar hook-associated protein 2